jgi:hypothetical protein
MTGSQLCKRAPTTWPVNPDRIPLADRPDWSRPVRTIRPDRQTSVSLLTRPQQANRETIHAEEPLQVTLDGEIAGGVFGA